MKKTFAAMFALALLAVAVDPLTHAGAKSNATKVVGKDPAGDWGESIDPATAPVGAALGQDLIQAAIGMADPNTLNFVIKVTSLPPTAGVPEFTRYTWEMTVDGEPALLDGKFTDYSRGACDPPPPLGSGGCPPPRDPGPQPFFIKTDCTTTSGLTSCKEKGIVKATFDAAAGTITVPVPLKLLGAKPGSKIAPATVIFGNITAQPAVRGSYTGFPYDRLNPGKTFVVPG